MDSEGKLRVLVSGASGLIGSALSGLLKKEGHEVWTLVRRKAGEREIAWDPKAGILSPDDLVGLDAVVHLAGATIASRWTSERKREIRESRVTGTRLLAESLAGLEKKPSVFLSASAIGFYGNRGEEEIGEDSAPGEGFLPEVCREWEAAASPAREAGIRTVNLRTGIVLTPRGGALAQMLLPFKLGLGGPTGNGRQWMSWISLTDEVFAIRHALLNPRLEGPVNLTAPKPVRNSVFAQVLGKALARPAFMPLPAFAVKAIFGEMGQNLLLDGQKVLPHKLTESGYVFSHPDLASALRFELGKGELLSERMAVEDGI